MVYAIEQDALDLYGSDYVLTATDRDEDGSADVVSFDSAMELASSELNSYIGVKYDLPLAVVPPVLKRFCIDVALYIASPDSAELTEEKSKRYEAAIAWAMGVAAGEISLGTADQPAGVDEEGGTVQTEPSTSNRAFTRTKLGGLL